MKKKERRFSLALELILMLTLALGSMFSARMVTFAAESGSITIAKRAGLTFTSTDTFNAYKIFDLSYAGDSYLYTLNSNFSSFTNYSGYGSIDLKECLESGLSAGEMQTLANNLLAYIAAESISASKTVTADAGNPGNVVMSSVEYGYYLVTGSASGVTASPALITVDGAVGFTLKADAATLEKKVYNESTSSYADFVDAAIGDTLTFRLVTDVPDTDSDTDYTFSIHDKMDDGLTFDTDSVVVKIGGTTAVGSDYSLITNQSDGCTFEISFNASSLSNYTPGAEIVVTYKATLNRRAVINSTGNGNKAHLQFGHKSGSITETEPDAVRVYTLGIKIFKYTGANTPLSGAVFELRTVAADQSSAIHFEKTEDGTSTLSAVYKVAESNASGTVTTMLTPASGQIMVQGLDAGTYYLVETQAPTGYNLLDGEIKIDTSRDTLTGNTILSVNDVASNEVNVLNNAGAIFPATGGIGRTIFIMVGSLMMVGAAGGGVILRVVNKRRQSAAKQPR